MVSTEELELLQAVGQVRGEADIRLIKRMGLPLRPRAIEEICWSLGKAGFLDLLPRSGIVKLSEKGKQVLGKTYTGGNKE